MLKRFGGGGSVIYVMRCAVARPALLREYFFCCTFTCTRWMFDLCVCVCCVGGVAKQCNAVCVYSTVCVGSFEAHALGFASDLQHQTCDTMIPRPLAYANNVKCVCVSSSVGVDDSVGVCVQSWWALLCYRSHTSAVTCRPLGLTPFMDLVCLLLRRYKKHMIAYCRGFPLH